MGLALKLVRVLLEAAGGRSRACGRRSSLGPNGQVDPTTATSILSDLALRIERVPFEQKTHAKKKCKTDPSRNPLSSIELRPQHTWKYKLELKKNIGAASARGGECAFCLHATPQKFHRARECTTLPPPTSALHPDSAHGMNASAGGEPPGTNEQLAEGEPPGINDHEQLTRDFFRSLVVGDVDHVQKLLDAHADANACDDLGESAMATAAMHNRADIIQLLFFRNVGGSIHFDGRDPFLHDSGEWPASPPLHAAAEKGAADALKMLLWLKADPRSRWQGRNALERAVCGGSRDCVAALLDAYAATAGAGLGPREDMDARGDRGAALTRMMRFAAAATPAARDAGILRCLLERQVLSARDLTASASVLCSAAENSNLDAVQLLIELKCDVNQHHPSATDVPFLSAAFGGNTACMAALIAARADVKVREPWRGGSALHVAARRHGSQNLDMIRFLVERGVCGGTEDLDSSGRTRCSTCCSSSATHPPRSRSSPCAPTSTRPQRLAQETTAI